MGTEEYPLARLDANCALVRRIYLKTEPAFARVCCHGRIRRICPACTPRIYGPA
jgi:hypothetical protein